MKPRFVSADKAGFLKPDDRVVGVAHAGAAKAYPLRILNWHEVVNDTIGTVAVAVTYCPLTASAVVFDRTVNARLLTFGVSGLLYQSNVLMYDHQSESLWSQLLEEAVTGPSTGTRLRTLPSVTTTWADWHSRYPATLVLSPHTGHVRDYARDPYADYHDSEHVMFPVRHFDARLPAKEKVVGVRVGNLSKAYTLTGLAGVRRVEDDVGTARLRIDYDVQSARADVLDVRTGKPWPAVVAYWFAWAAFHPDTLVWPTSSLPTPKEVP